MIQVMQQVSGINLITYYATTIYQNEIGLGGLTSRALAAANGTGAAAIWLDRMITNHLHSRILCSILDRGFHHREIWPSSAVRLFGIACWLPLTIHSMLFGAAGQSFSMIILAIMVSRTCYRCTPTCLMSVQDRLGGKGPGIVAALFLFLFNTFFAVGWLGMTWLYPAEIVPLRIRAPANALATSANWV